MTSIEVTTMDGLDFSGMTETELSLSKVFGLGFPDMTGFSGMDDEAKVQLGKKLRAWLEAQVQAQAWPMGDKKLHWARHRLFRLGRQWISTRDSRKWRELGAEGNRIRAVFNFVGPALDFRLGLLDEQRPGFQHEPMPGGGVEGRERAEAQQSVVEHVYKRDQFWQMARKAAAYAQTDGVAFILVYIDKHKGGEVEEVETIPKGDPRYRGMKAQGHKVVAGGVQVSTEDTGRPAGPGAHTAQVGKGDISQQIISAFHVWADPEARSINGPEKPARWMFIRRPRDLNSARQETGDLKLESDRSAAISDDMWTFLDPSNRWDKGLPPYPQSRQPRTQPSVWEHILYIPKCDEVPGGLWVHMVADTIIDQGKLPGGLIPLARMTDGSSDDDLFPRPVMADWIGDQISLNAVGSKILEYGRLHSGSRLLALADTQISENWNNIVGSILSYQGPKPDILPAPRANPDLWSMFNVLMKQLENKTGWHDLGRGKVSGDSVQGMQDVSGRATLAAREMYERQFGPMVRAAAQGVTEWAKLVVAYAQYLYDQPRLIPMAGRGDLAKKLGKAELQGPCCVYLDPETLMPLPRALRNQMLFDLMKEGLISREEYRQRAPFSEIRDVQMGGTDQWNRVQWINTVLEEGWEEMQSMPGIELYGSEAGVLIFWQDDPATHMRGLEELILDERKPWPLRKMAADRWGIYADLLRAKSWTPDQLAAGIPQPPAPAEVVGVPNNVPQLSESLPQQRVQSEAPAQAGGMAPGGAGQPSAQASPGSGPIALPQGSTMAANPLGQGDGLEA